MEPKISQFQIGEDLYGVSIDELDKRISVLQDEISRLEYERARKIEERDAAEQIFAPRK